MFRNEPIGNIIRHNGLFLKVVKRFDKGMWCNHCAFFAETFCHDKYGCRGYERCDQEAALFLKIDSRDMPVIKLDLTEY